MESAVENEEPPQVTARRAWAGARYIMMPPDHTDVTQTHSCLGPDQVFADDLCQSIGNVRQFLTDDFELFATQPNLCSVQKHLNKPLNMDRDEPEQWLALWMYFSICKVPNVREH